MITRRNFIKSSAALGAITMVPDFLQAGNLFKDQKIWASLIHLSFNMWEDHDKYRVSESKNQSVRYFDNNLRFSETLWDDYLKKMVKNKMNMVVIDLGDAVKYDSHPEIAINNAWTPSKVRAEVKKLKAMGLEPIPKLNFSAGHDQWLHEYSRMVSTETYYKVCSELIEEVCELFDKPRFFHIGYDEETAQNQRFHSIVTVRQGDLWWHDFHFFVNEVEKNGARTWIWSDLAWEHEEEFFKKMPKSVLQSNWYYKTDFSDPDSNAVRTYLRLAKEGYDQIPCGGYFVDERPDNREGSMMATVQFAANNFDNDRLLGFLHSSWRPTLDPYADEILKGVDFSGAARKWYDSRKK